MPKVTILMPTHARNKSGYLLKAIDSVIAQTFTDYELMIIDDGSVDGTTELIKSFMTRDKRVKTYRLEKNCGLTSITTAAAYAQTTGEIIAWQFDDCIWEPTHLELLVRELDSKPHVGFTYGQVIVELGDQIKRFGSALDLNRLLLGENHIPAVGTAIRRSVYEKIGWHDPHVILKRNNDWDVWIRIAKAFPTSFIEQVIAKEHGPNLKDSLGNSVSIMKELVMKYITINRNDYLHPSKVATWKPFEIPAGLVFNNKEKRNLAFLITEHFIRTGSYAEVADYIKPLLSGEDINFSSNEKLLLWFINEYRQYATEEIVRLNNYIQTQRLIINEKNIPQNIPQNVPQTYRGRRK